MSTVPRPLWQIAGGFALAHAALIPVGIYLAERPLFVEGTEGVTDSYLGGEIARSLTGGMLEAFGFLLMVPVLAFLGHVLGRGSEAGRWAARTGLLCGLGYVAVTFAVGFPAMAAAMYGVRHGLDPDIAFAINTIGTFGYFLSLMLLGGSTLGFALAALSDRLHVRWFGGFGVVTGLALVASTPLATVGQQDWGTLVWMVWFVGVAVLMLRHREVGDRPASGAGSVPHEASVGHS